MQKPQRLFGKRNVILKNGNEKLGSHVPVASQKAEVPSFHEL